MSPAAGLVAEATTVVFAYAADAALQEHVGRVVELCEELKREMEDLKRRLDELEKNNEK